MSTKTAGRARFDFDTALASLNSLVAYAQDPSRPVPSDIGLTQRGHALLSRTAGQDIARSWAVVFGDTIRLVNQFHDQDLTQRSQVADDEIERVRQTVLRATSALTDRINSLA